MTFIMLNIVFIFCLRFSPGHRTDYDWWCSWSPDQFTWVSLKLSVREFPSEPIGQKFLMISNGLLYFYVCYHVRPYIFTFSVQPLSFNFSIKCTDLSICTPTNLQNYNFAFFFCLRIRDFQLGYDMATCEGV
jgi:hypothetical protein